jgi:hypothetical protein
MIPGDEKCKRFINGFFQSRYGLFTCYDARAKYGMINLDAALIERYEKPRELKRMWNLAVISALYTKQLSWENIKQYRVGYASSGEFKSHLKRNSSHESSIRLIKAKQLKVKADERKEQ